MTSGDRRVPDGMRPIETPCINVCVVDEHGYCAGCRRTLDEIARWGSMTDEQRRSVSGSLPGRLAGGVGGAVRKRD